MNGWMNGWMDEGNKVAHICIMVLPIMASSNQCWAVIRNGTKRSNGLPKQFLKDNITMLL
jgi:hypothetical protein